MELSVSKVSNLAGGEGYAFVKNLLGEKQLKKCARLYAEITLKSGCSVGYHEHHNESETYYILSGEGIYNDNGTEKSVKKGDRTFTDDGRGHGIKNIGKEDLIFIALILTY